MAKSFDHPEVINRSRLCIRKVGYASEQRAWQVAIKMFKRHRALLWAFECKYCSKWHLGKTKNPYYQWLLREASATW